MQKYIDFLLPFFYIKRIISERALEEAVMKLDTEQVIATYKDRIFRQAYPF